MTDDPLLDYKGIAETLGVSVQAVRNYRWRGTLPAPDDTSVPDRPRWRRTTIESWKAKRPGQGARTDLARPDGT